MIYDLADGYFVRGLREEDLDGPYSSWFEDQEVCRFNSHGKFAKNAEWFREFYRGLNREDQLVWAVCHRDDGHVGNVSLQGISPINRNAEYAILIGNRQHWRRSVGLNASRTLLRHGFQKLNLERIYCGTAATNVGLQGLAAQLGMVEEGRRRKHLFLDGEWVDMVEFGVLRSEFEAKADHGE
jgi:[ribosomal protein S5]-alanine N-acetyltransferase